MMILIRISSFVLVKMQRVKMSLFSENDMLEITLRYMNEEIAAQRNYMKSSTTLSNVAITELKFYWAH